MHKIQYIIININIFIIYNNIFKKKPNRVVFFIATIALLTKFQHICNGYKVINYCKITDYQYIY
jgi:hypothetical protein